MTAKRAIHQRAAKSKGRKESIGLVIPTYQGEKHLLRLLPDLAASRLKPRILVVDSSSTDRTVEVAKEHGIETVTVRQEEFNHGYTREFARRLLDTEIVVMMTQDALPSGPEMLSKLVYPLVHGHASVSYARQIPRLNAGIFESFPREFNYPRESHIRDIKDLDTYGVYTFFCSNSCAAYLNSALDEIDGFPTVLTHEDYFVVARLLQRGHRIAYVAEAVVEHSHRYTLPQEFRRYFDAGYVRAQNPWMQEIVGAAERRGTQLAARLADRVLKDKPWLLPYTALLLASKWMGYRVGYYSLHMPTFWKRMLSSQKHYWQSMHYTNGEKRIRNV